MDIKNSKRVLNFTPAEKECLVNLIMKYSHILEDKKTNKVSIQEKNHVWDKIQVDFNNHAPTACFRSSDQLKRLYENKKKELRRKMANNKKETFLTGGGTSQNIKLDAVDEVLLQIVHGNTVTGFEMPFDCDSLIPENNLYSREVELSPLAESFTPLEKKKIWEETGSSSGKSHAPSLKRKRHEELELEFSSVETLETQRNIEITLEDSINEEVTERGKNLSSKYKRCPPKGLNASTSSELKTPNTSMNFSRRRPTTKIKTLTSNDVSDKYNILLDRRLVLVEKQIEQISEQQHFTREEHKQKLNVVNLEKEEKKLKIELLKLELSSKRTSM